MLFSGWRKLFRKPGQLRSRDPQLICRRSDLVYYITGFREAAEATGDG